MDGAGLYLLVNKSGHKYWRYNYRFMGKHKTLSIGIFPDVSLKEARDIHYQAKKLLSDGIDPSMQRKLDKVLKIQQAENSFEVIAKEWIEKQRPIWAKSHTVSVEGRLRNHVYGYIGSRPIVDITALELLAMMKPLELVGYNETAHRIRSVCGQVFRYAIVTGRATHDPSADLKGALTPVKKGCFAALTDPKEVGGLLRAIEEYTGDFVTKSALRLAPLVFVRPGELRRAEWSEINFKKEEWLIPAEKMKMKADHIVPLSQQAINILRETQEVTGEGAASKYVFPSVRTRTRPMSENTVNAALRRMGYTREEMTGHGFRAMASTLLNEQGFNEDWIESQLAHVQRNKVRAAYNRAKYLPQRKQMMQQWADYLDRLRIGADIIPFRANG